MISTAAVHSLTCSTRGAWRPRTAKKPLTTAEAVPTLPLVCAARRYPTGGQATAPVLPWTERGDHLNAGEEEGCQEEGFEEEEVRAPGTFGGVESPSRPPFLLAPSFRGPAPRPQAPPPPPGDKTPPPPPPCSCAPPPPAPPRCAEINPPPLAPVATGPPPARAPRARARRRPRRWSAAAATR